MGLDISVIICTYNRCDMLATVLRSLAAVDVAPRLSWEVMVVDNNSTDRTREVVEQAVAEGLDNLRYLFEGRQGKSHALNSAIEAAEGEILAFTDDDVTVHPGWLTELKSIFDRNPCLGAGGKIIATFDGTPPSWLRLDISRPFLSPLVSFDHGDTPCFLREEPYGANMAFRKEAFSRYGLFRTDLGPVEGNPMGKGEDSEFASRLLAAGELMMYAADAIIYHPVEKKRMEKKYFEEWYYNFGRASMARARLPENFVYWFGVPRFLCRQIMVKFLQWAFTFDSHRRLCHKLELWRMAGEAVEARQKSKGYRLFGQSVVS